MINYTLEHNEEMLSGFTLLQPLAKLESTHASISFELSILTLISMCFVPAMHLITCLEDCS